MRFKFFTALSLMFAFLAALIPLDHVEAQDTFSDIAGHPYEESILFLADRGIVEGYEDFTFQPDKIINRVEMLKILMERRFGESVGNQTNCFKDVTTEWFAKYVCRAKEEGIVQGYADGFFRPGQRIRMAEGLKMALEDFDLDLSAYERGEWYEKYVNYADEHDFFSKYSYLPNGSMTRGEMSYLVHQLILQEEGGEDEEVVDEEVIKSGEMSHSKEEIRYPDANNGLYYTNFSQPSSGCGVLPPELPPSEMKIDGQYREFITVVPETYDYNTPIKLVFAFHGRTNSNEQVRQYYGIEKAAGGKAIIVYPSGLPNDSGPRHWKDFDDPASDLRDYAFFDRMLEMLSAQYCIDMERVYVMGHSLGAWFTNSLACFRADKIRGVASLGGGTSLGDCQGPVAAMLWHNPNDQLSPFESGEQARDQLIQQNSCSNETVLVEPYEGNCVAYQDCNSGAPLVWCPHTIDYSPDGSYYPHTWPSVTGEAMWQFFEQLN